MFPLDSRAEIDYKINEQLARNELGCFAWVVEMYWAVSEGYRQEIGRMQSIYIRGGGNRDVLLLPRNEKVGRFIPTSLDRSSNLCGGPDPHSPTRRPTISYGTHLHYNPNSRW